MAADLPLSCGPTSWQYGSNGLWTVSATGPTYSGSGTAVRTSITYTVGLLTAQQPDHFATLIAADDPSATVTGVTSASIAMPCEGDNLTLLGRLSCHERTVRVNPAPSQMSFTVSLAGVRPLVPYSFVVRNNKNLSSCVIAGLGPQTEETPAPVTEIIREPSSDCAVEFTKDIATGKVINAELTPESVLLGCDFIQTPVENLRLSVKGLSSCPVPTLPDGSCPIGTAKFGEGYVHSGDSSCTTRIIGGRVYTWGSPCPE